MKKLVVHKSRIKNNIAIIHKRAENARVIGVLKGNGYGLGLVELARAIRDEGIAAFAVTEPADALVLRNAGFADEEILVLRSTAVHDEIKTIFEACATATIGSYDAAVAVSGIGKEEGRVVDAHIEVDTGMGRYGFLPEEADRILSVYRFMENVNVTGIYTHFYNAFSSEKATLAQLTALAGVVDKIREAGFDPGMVHAANSAALLKYSLAPLDAVRIGSALTGRVSAKGDFGLQRAGHLEADIIEIRWIPKGATIGYGGAFVTGRPTRIAVVSAGYGDGFMMERRHDVYRFRDMLRYGWGEVKRFLSGGNFYVLLGGKKAKILGHVGLAHTVIDVTELECTVGDTVVMDVSPTAVDSRILREYV